MTRPIPANFLADDTNVAIGNHLRNHVHLTNCIHLKNHMHRRHSPILAERSLMRDLLTLQRSRSLRDPSTTTPSWLTPQVSGFSGRKYDKDDVLFGGRRSFGIEIQREKENSPFVITSFSNNKVPSEGKVVSTEEEDDEFCRNKKSQPVLVYGKATTRRKYRSKKSTTHGPNSPFMTLAEQLQQCSNTTHICHYDKQNTRKESIHDDPQMSGNGSCRVKRRQHNLKEARRVRDSTNSNPLVVQDSVHCSYCLGGKQDDDELEATRSPRNGCGIPWNWSRIHHRGKSFLDKAGRGLSGGLSDSREARKAEPSSIIQSQRDATSFAADRLCSAAQSDSLPLLNDNACGSQESVEYPFLTHDYSGELGIFASNHNNEQDSSALCNARTVGNYKFRDCHNDRHQSLTQKYIPKTFKDLVGQNLVVQALVNAVQRKRVGLIYVFYGPQGTGKSSCARIFAKSLICQSLDRTKPCGDCNSCISYNKGSSQKVVEVGPVGIFDSEEMVEVFAKTKLTTFPSQYKVFIVDDCDKLPTNSWSSISKIIDQASRNVVFILVSTNLDNLPYIIMSRCQKIFFPKLKDNDIVYKLHLIASKENLEIDKDALKLIASRSYGSLRDAEMTLDQLSLLGQRISLNLVQELVGLVSDDKLVDLLDLALSAHTVNTIRSLREIIESGVEPLALMSQLATIITDILAGSYVFTRERLRRRFFRRPILSKEEIEKLRMALKTLSESEKQLRVSNDKITWLTASMLQLASDQQYMLPNSSGDTSFINSPLPPNHIGEREMLLSSDNKRDNFCNSEEVLSGVTRLESHIGKGGSNDSNENKGNEINTYRMQGKIHRSREIDQANGENKKIVSVDFERIWIAVLEHIQVNALKTFMHQEGKLVSVNFGVAPTVQLMFSTNINKSKAEKFRGCILQAFESVLCTGVTLEIRSGSWKCPSLEVKTLHNAAATCSIGSSQIRKETDSNTKKFQKGKVVKGIGSIPAKHVPSDFHRKSKSVIIEIPASPSINQQTDGTAHVGKKVSEHGCKGEGSHSHHQSIMLHMSRRKNNRKLSRCRSLVQSKVSLAHVLQKQAEGCAQRSGWSRQNALSIAEKLEQENLRLEPKSRNFLCWNTTRYTRRKLQCLRTRARTRTRTKTNPHSLLKLVACGRCSCAKTPR